MVHGRRMSHEKIKGKENDVGGRVATGGENGKKETESGIASPPLRQVSFSFRHPFTFSISFSRFGLVVSMSYVMYITDYT